MDKMFTHSRSEFDLSEPNSECYVYFTTKKCFWKAKFFNWYFFFIKKM